MDSDFRFFCDQCTWDDTTGTPLCFPEYTCHHYEAKSYIAHQGDEVRSLYILNKGRVRTEMVSSSGFTLSVEEIRAPYPLAALLLFGDRPYFPVDVIAIETSEVWSINKLSVEHRMLECPSFLRGFLAFGANRIDFLSRRLKIFSQRGIQGRLVHYILEREHKGAFELGRSITSLAEYMGVERPSLSRVFSELQRAGVISYASGRGHIKDLNALKELLG